MAPFRPLIVGALALLAACQTNQNAYEASLADPSLKGPGVAAPAADPFDPSAYRIENVSPGERPPLDSDEAGLWMIVDRMERRSRTAGNRMRDEKLQKYIDGIVCKLAGPYCGDIRTYVMRVPVFNATMAPNGMMQVWSGLLLRVRNEAQLAAVLGHEIGHYLRRHSLQKMRDTREKAAFAVVVRLASAAVGVPALGDLTALATYGTMAAFNRDNEREADGYGIVLLSKAGYDPREASKVWSNLMREMSAAKNKKESDPFFGSHPPSQEREEALVGLASKLYDPTRTRNLGSARFAEIVLPHRAALLRDDLGMRKYDTTLELYDMLLEEGVRPGEIHFFRGELYRTRKDEGDLELAMEAYDTALTTGDAPPEIHRSRGLVLRNLKRTDEARAAFRSYLEAVPGASDRAMIRALLDDEWKASR